MRLSVVIPTRNCLAWLPRALASAQAVPVEGLEIIVVDDGSSDGTAGFLAEAAGRDPRIVVVRREGGEGAAAARNAGIAVARAPVIGFLDADDAWRPEEIADRLAWHEAHPETAMSFSEYETLLPGGGTEPRLMEYLPRFQAAVAGRSGTFSLGAAGAGLLYGENPVCTSVVFASRDALRAVGGFDVGLRQAEDWDLWIRLALHGPVAYVAQPQGFHMARPGSLSSEVRARCTAVAVVLRRHRAAMLRRSPAAVLCAAASVAEARSELAQAEGKTLGHVAGQVMAFGCRPTWRRLRGVARAAALGLGLVAPRRQQA